MDNLHDLERQERDLSMRRRDAFRDASVSIAESDERQLKAFAALSAALETIDQRIAEEDDRHTSAMQDLVTARDRELQRYGDVAAEMAQRRAGVITALAAPSAVNSVAYLPRTGSDG